MDNKEFPCRHEEDGKWVWTVKGTRDSASDILRDIAKDTLKRHGIRAELDGIMVSTSHSGIKELLSGTPWAIGWSNVLRRVPGATSPQKNARFPGGLSTKVTAIPWIQPDSILEE